MCLLQVQSTTSCKPGYCSLLCVGWHRGGAPGDTRGGVPGDTRGGAPCYSRVAPRTVSGVTPRYVSGGTLSRLESRRVASALGGRRGQLGGEARNNERLRALELDGERGELVRTPTSLTSSASDKSSPTGATLAIMTMTTTTTPTFVFSLVGTL